MIEVRGVSKRYLVGRRESSGVLASLRSLFRRDYAAVTALDAVDFQVERGEIHALLGRNGSGKSTLIKILCGILHPTSGEARVGGVVPWRERARYVRHIGVVFGQKTQLTWELPAIDSFALQRSLYGIPPAEFERTLAYLVTAFGATVDRPVRSLSLGERMKCEILCALLHRPRVLFLDEPTIGLDLVSKDQVRSAIREVNAELGTTIVLTSHDISDVATLCRRISLLDSGRFVYRGGIEELLQRHGRRVIRIELERDVPDAALDGYSFVRTGERSLTLELERRSAPLAELVSALLRRLPVADLVVESMQLEQVIKSIYGVPRVEASRGGVDRPRERGAA